MYIDKEKLEEYAEGRWFDIFEALAPDLQEAIDECPNHVPCPFHGGKDGFRFFDDSEETGVAICNTCGTFGPYKLLIEANDWDFKTSLQKIAEYLEKTGILKVSEISKGTAKNSKKDNVPEYEKIQKIEGLDKELFFAYMANRGIENLPNELLDIITSSPNYPYYEKGEETRYFPTLFFPIKRLDGELVGYTKLHIDSETSGKANIEHPKKFTEPKYPKALNGAAIQLMEVDGNAMGIAEGVETALAVSSVVNYLPIWSTLSANGIKTFEPPENVKKLYIFADNDLAGMEAALKAAERLTEDGLAVHIICPADEKTDWLDELNENGKVYTRQAIEIAINENLCLYKKEEADSADIEELRFSPNEEDIIRYMNHNHFVVMLGEKTKIAKIERKDKLVKLSFINALDFNLFYKNWKTSNDSPASSFWLSSEERRTYHKILFMPGKNAPDSVYNLFHGWALTPQEGNCEKYLDHIKQIICDNDEIVNEYVLNWLAHMFQKPYELPETAIILMGEPGVGKSFFVNALKALVEPYFFKMTNKDHLTGRFSSHLENTILAFGDEIDMEGEKTTLLNGLISEAVISVEGKFVPVKNVDNYLRLIIASNNYNPMQLHDKDRRFLPLRVSNARRKDFAYFSKLSKELENGGHEALFHYLLNRNISDFNPRALPLGRKKFEMLLNSADSFTQWLYDFLDDHENWQETVVKKELFEQYKNWNKDNNTSANLTQATFGKRLKQIFSADSLQDSRLGPEEERQHAYIFGSLWNCRKKFIEHYDAETDIWSEPLREIPLNRSLKKNLSDSFDIDL